MTYILVEEVYTYRLIQPQVAKSHPSSVKSYFSDRPLHFILLTNMKLMSVIWRGSVLVRLTVLPLHPHMGISFITRIYL